MANVVRARYSAGSRPLSWDERKDGLEIVRTVDGEEVVLFSSGQQSSPAPGWELLLTKPHDRETASRSSSDGSDALASGSSAPAYEWTLYGLGQLGDSES